MKKITIQLLARYKDIYKDDNTEVLKRICEYPLEIELAELAGINYELRGSKDLYSNMDINVQENILNKWLYNDKYQLDLYIKLNTYSKTKKNQNITIFNRAACLYGIDFGYRKIKIYHNRFCLHEGILD